MHRSRMNGPPLTFIGESLFLFFQMSILHLVVWEIQITYKIHFSNKVYFHHVTIHTNSLRFK